MRRLVARQNAHLIRFRPHVHETRGVEMVMRRIVGAALTAAAVVAVTAPTAYADKGGFPQQDSCGVGRTSSQVGRADPTRPGNSEIRDLPPVAFGCTGRP